MTDDLDTAALALVRAYDANVDASNGLGHRGEDHDRFLHHSSGGDMEIYSTVDDCAACGGAQYGADEEIQSAVVAVKLALGEPLRGYEEMWRP